MKHGGHGLPAQKRRVGDLHVGQLFGVASNVSLKLSADKFGNMPMCAFEMSRSAPSLTGTDRIYLRGLGRWIHSLSVRLCVRPTL